MSSIWDDLECGATGDCNQTCKGVFAQRKSVSSFHFRKKNRTLGTQMDWTQVCING